MISSAQKKVSYDATPRNDSHVQHLRTEVYYIYVHVHVICIYTCALYMYMYVHVSTIICACTVYRNIKYMYIHIHCTWVCTCVYYKAVYNFECCMLTCMYIMYITWAAVGANDREI